jgi:hypothetical protein
MSESSSPVSSLVALEERKSVSQVSNSSPSSRKRPKRGSNSRMYANIRSAAMSILVYRQRSVLTVSGIAIGALVAAVATTLIQDVRALPVLPLYMQSMTIVFMGSALISFAAGGLASMNSMLVSVAERTHEMSMRMVVGARRCDIRYQILLEALLLSSTGAVLGTSSGLLISFMLTLLLQLSFMVDPILILLILGTSLAMGVIGGIYPAQRASCLDPGETLRRG